MRSFSDVYALAADKKGGGETLETILAETPSLAPAVIAKTADDRILSEMTRRIFHAGISWAMVDNKWPAFETAFHAFDPHACAFLTDDDVTRLMGDRGIVRHAGKIRAVQINARLVLDLAAEHGCAARFFASWPDADHAGLREFLKTRASHLGGAAAGRFLRAIGKPAYVMSPDTVAALIREGVLTKPPGGKRNLAAVQEAFNLWAAESGRDLTVIRRVLAISV